MKITVIGQTGQLARALDRKIPEAGYSCMFCGREAINLVASNEDIATFVNGVSDVDLVINAAAYTAVDAAEGDSDAAFAVNSNAPAP